MKTQIRSLWAVLLVLALLFVTVSAPFGILHMLHHDCAGEDCPVCALVLACASACAHLTWMAAVLLVLTAAGVSAVLLTQARPGSRREIDRVGRGIRLLN